MRRFAPPRLTALVLMVLLAFAFVPASAVALSNINVYQSTDITNSVGVYAITFTTGVTHSLTSIHITFPAGFSFSGSTIDLLTSTNLAAGSLSATGQTIVWTFKAAQVSEPFGRVIQLVIGGITAPAVSPKSDNNEPFTVTISTYYTLNLVETGTSNAFYVRQITGADIATSANLDISSALLNCANPPFASGDSINCLEVDGQTTIDGDTILNGQTTAETILPASPNAITYVSPYSLGSSTDIWDNFYVNTLDVNNLALTGNPAVLSASTAGAPLELQTTSGASILLQPGGTTELTVAPGGPVTVAAGGIIATGQTIDVGTGGTIQFGATNSLSLSTHTLVVGTGINQVNFQNSGGILLYQSVSGQPFTLQTNGLGSIFFKPNGVTQLTIAPGGPVTVANGLTVSAGGISAIGQIVNVGSGGTLELGSANAITVSGSDFSLNAGASFASGGTNGAPNVLTAAGDLYLSGHVNAVLNAQQLGGTVSLQVNGVNIGQFGTTVTLTPPGDVIVTPGATHNFEVTSGDFQVAASGSVTVGNGASFNFGTGGSITFGDQGVATIGTASDAASTVYSYNLISPSNLNLEANNNGNDLLSISSTEISLGTSINDILFAANVNSVIQTQGTGTLTINSGAAPLSLQTGGTSQVIIGDNSIPYTTTTSNLPLYQKNPIILASYTTLANPGAYSEIYLDSGGNIHINTPPAAAVDTDISGTTELSVDNTGIIATPVLRANGGISTTSGDLTLTSGAANGNIILTPTGTGTFEVTSGLFQVSSSGIITNYNNVATAGLGVPAVYGYGAGPHTTSSVSSAASYTPTSVNQAFLVGCSMAESATAGGSASLLCNITYTDGSGNSQSFTLANTGAPGETSEYAPIVINAGSASSITISITLSGTISPGYYSYTAFIQQVG